jgi:hypothetical protein
MAKNPPWSVCGNETMAAEEYCKSKQSGMECNRRDYLVCFLSVNSLVLRGYERERHAGREETAVIIRLLWWVFSSFFTIASLEFGSLNSQITPMWTTLAFIVHKDRISDQSLGHDS